MSNEPCAVRLTGWTVGFRTIDLMVLIRKSTGLGLGKAKAMVERVLDGGEVTIPFASEEDARTFWEAAGKTGVIGSVDL